MERLNPEKLYVEFREGVTAVQPVIPRRYTLTHSDVTAELFLTIAREYAYDKIGPMRDEVLAEWRYIHNSYIFYVYCYIDGQFDRMLSEIRNRIFVRELPLALEAIRYGDRVFFQAHPELDNAPILIYFDSKIPELNRIEYWGRPSDYR